MRFLSMIVFVCKGISKGIHGEVKRLASISEVNTFIKQRKEELIIEYERLGEYVYASKRVIEDEVVMQYMQTIDVLVSEIETYKQQLTQLRDE